MSASRPVYPGSTLLLEVDKNVQKYMKTPRKKDVRPKDPPPPRKSERIVGGLMPLFLHTTPLIDNTSATTIGIFPTKQKVDITTEKYAHRARARSAIRQAFDTIRIRDDNDQLPSVITDASTPFSSPRLPTHPVFTVDHSSLPIDQSTCVFSANLADEILGRRLLEGCFVNHDSSSHGAVAIRIAKHFNACVVESSEEPNTDTKRDVLVIPTGDESPEEDQIENEDNGVSAMPLSTISRRKYAGIRKAVFLVDREPTMSRFHGNRRRPKTANILFGVSGKHVVPLNRLPNEEDRALRHLMQVENAIDSALRQLQMALHFQLGALFDLIGPVVRQRSFVTLTPGTASIELDIPCADQRKAEGTVQQKQRSSPVFREYMSQSYRRKFRPMTAATSTPSGCGLQVVGTTAPTKPSSLPVPFCFNRFAATPSPNSSVQFIFVPDVIGQIDSDAVDFGLGIPCLTQGEIVFKSWAVLYGFQRCPSHNAGGSNRASVLEYVGNAGASVTGKCCVVPSQAAVRFLATLRRIQPTDNDNAASEVQFCGVAYLPVWTSLSNDSSIAESCVLALVCFFDAPKPTA